MPALLQTLQRIEESRDGRVGNAAENLILPTLRDSGVIPKLIELIENGDAPMRGQALMALAMLVNGEAPGREAVPALVRLLKENNGEHADAAVLAIHAVLAATRQAESPPQQAQNLLSRKQPLFRGRLKSVRYTDLNGNPCALGGRRWRRGNHHRLPAAPVA